MLFDGFIPIDTREGLTPPSKASNPTRASNSNSESGWGEGTPMPYGPIASPPPAPYGPNPNPSGDSGSKVDLGQYVTPGTIVAGAGLIGTVASLFKKSDEQKTLKAVCGRKPILNIGGKRDAYLACVDSYLHPQNAIADTGMSGSKIALIVFLILLFLAIVITVVVMANKNKTTAA